MPVYFLYVMPQNTPSVTRIKIGLTKGNDANSGGHTLNLRWDKY